MALLFYHMKHWHFSNIYMFGGMLEVHLSRTKAKLVWRKKNSRGKGPLMVFKTPRQMERTRTKREPQPSPALKGYYHTTTSATVIAFLFTLTRSLMKFYSI